jgi:hypothetical protein
MVRDRGLERNAERGRGFIGLLEVEDYNTKYEGEQSEPRNWKELEWPSLPLGWLRALHDVRIEGTVTERWARWLEGAAMSVLGKEVEVFEFASPRARVRVQDTLRPTMGQGSKSVTSYCPSTYT